MMKTARKLGLVSTRGTGIRFQSLVALLAGALIIITCAYQKGAYQKGERKWTVEHETSSTVQHETSSTVEHEKSSTVQHETSSTVAHETSSTVEHETSSSVEHETSSSNVLQGCNLYSGKWVYDNKSYPLYEGPKCRFMQDEFACQKYGREDLKHQQWRWQPHDCVLPRFDAAALLEKLRGKRLVFVGDSLNRNQWASLVCLVQTYIPPGLIADFNGSFSFEKYFNNSLYNFKALDYNVSIDFYWSPFLVESSCDDPVHHNPNNPSVKVDAIESHARRWIDADILVFNSYIWWAKYTFEVRWGSTTTSDIEMVPRYAMGLKTWANWLETHVDRAKTKMFFVGMSPVHFTGKEWGNVANENCYNETEPIFKDRHAGSFIKPKMIEVLEETIDRLEVRGVKVHFINITQLSEYRKDGHPSIHRRQWTKLTEEQLSNPRSYSDCAHWCLPGVPDTWNELLYVNIFNS